MAYVRLAQVNIAIAKAGVPFELERGEGYQYFIYDVPARGVYETISIYTCYLSDYTVDQWVELARSCWQALQQRMADRGY